MPETADDSRRYFNVERVPATKLDALLAATEAEGHRLIHLRVEQHATTRAYLYTLFFKHALPRLPRTKKKHAKRQKG